ncbi:histidine kinase [Kitasatospora sp. NPDC056181]|uniref:sensor histidine kinase n=1 Tax=Kitasatospora sp. NPDC056181 TaxID=3345737 RepID=UPI0035DE3B78
MSTVVVARAAARVGQALRDGVRALYAVTLAVAGAAAVLAAPVLVLAALLGPDDSSAPNRFRALTAMFLATLPVAVWALSWATGAAGRAAGAALLAPGLLAVTATVIYGGAAPSGRSGALLLALPMLVIGMLAARWVAAETRRLVGLWSGTAIAPPYRPTVTRGPRWRRLWRQAGSWPGDPATWRDTAWAVLSGCAVVLTAVALLMVPALVQVFGRGSRFISLLMLYTMALWLAPPVALWAARPVLTLHERAARALLGSSRRTELALQVSHLTRTRADTIDAGAAELRRIERDLHDGAQARLVALGMLLSVAEQLLDHDPQALRPLLAEARTSSAKALGELRDLVRGIHPPVLADRGLADAVHAMALDLPLPVRVTGGLPGRPPAPVESAAYFAVSELLANVVKHAGAGRVWIEIGHDADGLLRISVTDDGHGGADPSKGTGLRGTERRLAAFDGVLAVSSPPGGPTIAQLEIPCALSSPKTFSSSGTA